MTHHTEHITVICPKHGEHEHAITSNIPGHEGVWCQICWIESMGESLPYRRNSITPEDKQDIMAEVDRQFDAEFKTMDEMIPVPEAGWMSVPKA